jgi:hypothetical protein
LMKKAIFVDEKQEEVQKIISEFAARAQLHEDEKKEFIASLESNQRELTAAKAELELLRERYARAQAHSAPQSTARPTVHEDEPEISEERRRRRVDRWTSKTVVEKMGKEFSELQSSRAKRLAFRGIAEGIPYGYVTDLKALGFVDESGDLTDAGADYFTKMVTQKFQSE